MSASSSTLNVTAITTSNQSSVFECWALDPGFVSSTQAGTVGALSLQLGGLSNASYSVLPAGFNAGVHNAPNVQFVAFLCGLAHITLPNSTDEAWVVGGRNGLIIATDTAEYSLYGHNTTYPSNETTVGLQIPTEGGVVPGHTVLHSGPCQTENIAMQRKRGLEELD